ncbi:DUF4294 domain-containing protein [Wenyingzhuangia sp. IMCC45533]
MKKKISILLCLFSLMAFSQENTWEQLEKKYKDYYLVTDPNGTISLDTVVLFPKPKFKTNYDRRYYQWFKKKTYRAYPYAVLAKNKIEALNDTIYLIKSKRKRKRYVKRKQKYFENEFANDVKKLTKTEGRILIKLIHRLTGSTVNEHVQDKRGNFKAFIYRISASLFKIDLDLEYHPESEMEDYMIENILQHAFQDGDLERMPSVLKTANRVYPNKLIEIEKKN